MINIDDRIKKNGNYKYAIINFVLNDDIYVIPSITFVETLRTNGCLVDLIVFIDDKISYEAINILKIFYNKIINIKSVYIKNKDLIQSVIINKFHALKLIEYEQIMIIDVDTIIYKNIDNCFNNNINNDVMYLVDNNYGIILVKPSTENYKKALKIINEDISILENKDKPYEILMNELYKNIKDIKINGTKLKISLNKYENSNSYGIQYKKIKPFLMTSNKSIELRTRLKHFNLWFYYFNKILNLYPEIKNNKLINETFELHKYFIDSITKMIYLNNKINLINMSDNVKLLYGFNDINYTCYHFDISKNNKIKFNINTDINYFDYKKFLDKISNYISIDDNLYKFDNIFELVNYQKNNKIIDTNNINNVNDNLLLYYYLKYNNNVYIALLINDNNDSNMTNKLSKNKIYYNEFILKGNIIKNMLFDIYNNYTYEQRIFFLDKYDDNKIYKIIIEIFENIEQIDYLDKYYNDTFLFYDYNSKLRLASIFLIKNTFLYYKNKENIILNRDKLMEILYFETIKKWIYKNYTVDEINNIILISNKKIINKNNKYIILDFNNYNKKMIKRIKNDTINLILLKIINEEKDNIKAEYHNKINKIKDKIIIIEGIKNLL